jgi:hypothetical protein
MPKVYVVNLHSSATRNDHLTHFVRAGEAIGALAATDKASGLFRGFGFVRWLYLRTSRLHSAC